MCSASCPLRKIERAGPTENQPPPHSAWLWDRKLTGILTGTPLDYRPQPGETSLAFGWSVIAVKPTGRGVVDRVAPQEDFCRKYIKKYVKMLFLDIMSEVQKYVFIKNPIHQNFVQNLASKSLSPTLTLPSTIRVKQYHFSTVYFLISTYTHLSTLSVQL